MKANDPTREGEAAANLARDCSAAYTSNTSKSLADRGPAPLHLLVDRCGCSRPDGRCQCAPRVHVIERENLRFVAFTNRPRGWHNRFPNRTFFVPPGAKSTGKGALAYANEIRAALSAEAWDKWDRRERRREYARREALAEAKGRL